MELFRCNFAMAKSVAMPFPRMVPKFPSMFYNINEFVANFHCNLIAIQLQFTYHIFIVILFENCNCFATDLSVAKFLLQNRIFLVVTNYSPMIDKIHNLIMNLRARIIQDLRNHIRELFIYFLNKKA